MLQELKNRLSQNRSRRNNRAFLEATMASCALIAMADNEVTFSESSKIDQILMNLEELRVYDVHEEIDLFNEHVDAIRMNPEVGRADALRSIALIREDSKAARIIVRICIAIAQSDGAVSLVETNQLDDVCRMLDLDPSEFGIQSNARQQ